MRIAPVCPIHRTNNRTKRQKTQDDIYANTHIESLLEMISLYIEIETTRDIAHQIVRHRFQFPEFSQRYAEPLQWVTFNKRECRLQDYENRQNSID